MKTSPVLALCLALACIGCHSRNAHETTRANQPNTGRHSRAETNATPGIFDYYVLNLSWSPEFCDTHPDSEECAARPGFVVHGLWPQNNDGTYPENCSEGTRVINPVGYIDLIPTIDLIEHEWATHGSCSGLNSDAYFSQVRTALQSIEIPSTFAAVNIPPARAAPSDILAQFRRDNPTFPRSSFVLSCGNNYLTAINVCFSKSLTPIPCQNLRSCQARTIKITPR